MPNVIDALYVQAIRVLRVLCREEFSISSARTFVEDIKTAMDWLTGHYIYTPQQVSVHCYISPKPSATNFTVVLLHRGFL